MTKDEAIIIFGGIIFILYILWSCKKRSNRTCNCPRCGATSHASPWSSGLRNSDGSPIVRYKCPKCGHTFQY